MKKADFFYGQQLYVNEAFYSSFYFKIYFKLKSFLFSLSRSVLEIIFFGFEEKNSFEASTQ